LGYSSVDWLLSALLYVVLTSIVGYVAYRKLKNILWDTIDDFGTQFAEKLNEQLGSLISPVVKKGFSLAGSLGGEAKAVKELQNRITTEYLDKNFGEYKMLAQEIFGVDVDGLLEEYGAPTVVKAISGLAGIIGQGGKGFNLGTLFQGKNNPRGNVPSM